jgi:hypothetical protein
MHRRVRLLGLLNLPCFTAEGEAADLQLPDALLGLIDELGRVIAQRGAGGARQQQIM